MGLAGSKQVNDEALAHCKDRLRHIKQTIDSRNALSAAHLAYMRSLQHVGTALRQFAEAEQLPASLLTMSDLDKSPAHSSFASLSPSHFVELPNSPSRVASTLSPPLSNVSYMKATGLSAVTVTIDPLDIDGAGPESPSFLLPPPPPPPELCSSWDYFDTTNAPSGPPMNSEAGLSLNFSRLKGLRQSRDAEVVPLIEEELKKCSEINAEKSFYTDVAGNAAPELKNKDEIRSKRFLEAMDGSKPSQNRAANAENGSPMCTEREDAAEFITHRAKDLVSSMKDIENRFHKASEAGSDLSRMLETKKIKLSICSSTTGRPSPSVLLVAFDFVCCKRVTIFNQESVQDAARVITWNRSVSSMSSPSRHPLTSVAKDDPGDHDGEFVEQFAMVSGSHTSTLDRLYAWERKLFDEIKASERIRKAYDEKCSLLRSQFAQDANASLIDKTRATVKDLHSRVCVAIQAVDSISRRIEKLRDDELQPQLVELIQGFIRMWRAMLKCHHAQFITISLAYHARPTSAVPPQLGTHPETLQHVVRELDFFASSLTNRVAAEKSYVEALNAWLQKCILQPQEIRKGRRGRRKETFPPRNAIQPPIFTLCKEWATGLESLPIEDLSESINALLAPLRESIERQSRAEDKSVQEPATPEPEENRNAVREHVLGLASLKPGLAKVLDCLTKYAEASLKLYEELRRRHEAARAVYKSAAAAGSSCSS